MKYGYNYIGGNWNEAQRFGAWRSGGFRSTKLSIHHKS